MTEAFVEEFCDTMSFPSNAAIESWCMRHNALSFQGARAGTKGIYNSIAIHNVTRTILHTLNGTTRFSKKPDEPLFWTTIGHILELSGGSNEDINALLRKTGNMLFYPPNATDGKHIWKNKSSRLFGQIAQLIDFLGPYGPGKGHFTLPTDWSSFASAYGATDLIGGIDDRLQKSKRFGDDDYPREVNELLLNLSKRSLDDAFEMCFALGSDLLRLLENQYSTLKDDAERRFSIIFRFLREYKQTEEKIVTTPQATIKTQPEKPSSDTSQSDETQSEDKAEVTDAFIKIQRGVELIGSQFEYKVKVANYSNYVITDVCVAITSYPEEPLKIIEPSLRKSAKLEPEGFWSPSFIFQPTKDCVQGTIIATISYLDYSGKPHSLQTRSQKIQSVCDLLQPLESKIDEFFVTIDNMEQTSDEFTLQLNAQLAFRMLVQILPLKNFQIIYCNDDEISGSFLGKINCLAKGKYTGSKIALILDVVGTSDSYHSPIKATLGGDHITMIPAALSELTKEIHYLRTSIDTLMSGTTHLMKAARMGLEYQKEIKDIINKSLNESECNTALIKSLIDFAQERLAALESGRLELAAVISEIEEHVRYTAEKILLDKSLGVKLKDGMRWIASSMAGEGVGTILWNVIKIPLGAYLGVELP